MKVVLPSLDSFCRYKRFLFSLAALVDPVQNILFLAAHYFTSFVLTVQQAGQVVVRGRLSLLCASLMMTLAFRPTCHYFMSTGKSVLYAVNSLRLL
jgi:hypothetical protein